VPVGGFRTVFCGLKRSKLKSLVDDMIKEQCVSSSFFGFCLLSPDFSPSKIRAFFCALFTFYSYSSSSNAARFLFWA